MWRSPALPSIPGHPPINARISCLQGGADGPPASGQDGLSRPRVLPAPDLRANVGTSQALPQKEELGYRALTAGGLCALPVRVL